MLSSISFEIFVPISLLVKLEKVDCVTIGIENFSAIFTHLLCKTLAPSLESSLISLYDIFFNLLADFTLFGSAVYTPSTSENI